MDGDRPYPPEQSFAVKDCTLIALATGIRAHTLEELAEALRAVPADSVYYHFWGTLLQSGFENREYNNDFASWARSSLDHRPLAERLAVLDPTDFASLDLLQQTVIDRVEAEIAPDRALGRIRGTHRFEFLRHQIVVFDTAVRVGTAARMAEVIPTLSQSSVFYHFIDARRRHADGIDDFRAWLAGLGGEDALRHQLAGIDPYFGQLADVRDALAAAFGAHASRPAP